MRTVLPDDGRSSPLVLLVGVALATLVVFGVLAFDVPDRIAALGSGNLDRVVAPTAKVAYGESVDLEGQAERPPLRITAQTPIPVTPLAPKARASEGSRLIGVELEVKNIGKVKWSATPVSVIDVADRKGVEYGVDQRVRRIRGAHTLPNVITLAPGKSVRGVVVFAVPRSAKVLVVRFTVGQGLTRTGEWTTSGKAS
jgi:hypothetical protein